MDIFGGPSFFWGFPDSSVGKESICNVGDLGLIIWIGRSPGEEKSYPLQYSGLENSMDWVGHNWETSFHSPYQRMWFNLKKFPGDSCVSKNDNLLLFTVTHNTQKRCPLHYRGLECKSRKSRNTWSNRQIWPWNTEWSRAKTNRVLPRKCTGHSKHPLPTTQEKTLYMDITTWSTPKSNWLYSLQPKMEKLYTVSINKTRNWLWLRSWTHCQIQT